MANIKLKVKPDELVSKSGEIKKDINAIEQSFTKVTTLVTNTKKYWEGDASDKHIKRYNELKEDFQTIVKRLKEHPDDLEKMAGVYKENENEIKNLLEALPTDVL